MFGLVINLGQLFFILSATSILVICSMMTYWDTFCFKMDKYGEDADKDDEKH